MEEPQSIDDEYVVQQRAFYDLLSKRLSEGDQSRGEKNEDIIEQLLMSESPARWNLQSESHAAVLSPQPNASGLQREQHLDDQRLHHSLEQQQQQRNAPYQEEALLLWGGSPPHQQSPRSFDKAPYITDHLQTVVAAAAGDDRVGGMVDTTTTLTSVEPHDHHYHHSSPSSAQTLIPSETATALAMQHRSVSGYQMQQQQHLQGGAAPQAPAAVNTNSRYPPSRSAAALSPQSLVMEEANQRSRIEGMMQILESPSTGVDPEPLADLVHVLQEMRESQASPIRVTVEAREMIQQQRANQEMSSVLGTRRNDLIEWEQKLRKEQQDLLKRKNAVHNAETSLKRAANELAKEKAKFVTEKRKLVSKNRSRSMADSVDIRAKSEGLQEREQSVSDAHASNEELRSRLEQKQQELDALAAALEEQVGNTRLHFETQAKKLETLKKEAISQQAQARRETRILSQSITKLLSLPNLHPQATPGNFTPEETARNNALLQQSIAEIRAVAQLLDEKQMMSSQLL